MKKLFTGIFLIVSIALVGVNLAHAEAENYISDQANILSADDEKALNQKLADLTQATDKTDGQNAGIQYAILTVNSTNGASIEDYAMNKFNEQGIGDKTKNRGVLFVIAVSDHEYRIQLGDGWNSSQYVKEKYIEDYDFTDSITDTLRDENYAQAINMLTNNMIGLMGTEINLPDNLQPLGKALASQIEQDEIKKAEFKRTATKVALVAVPTLLIGGISTGAYFGIKHRKKQKEIESIASLFNIEYAFDEDREKLKVTNTELAKAFIASEMEPTQENISQFFKAYRQNAQNYDKAVKHGKIKHAKRYNKKQIVLDMTSRTNGYYYRSWDGDWWTTMMMYNMISRNYYTPVYAASIAPKVDSSSKSDSNWSNFGGGGFSGGGGASGGW